MNWDTGPRFLRVVEGVMETAFAIAVQAHTPRETLLNSGGKKTEVVLSFYRLFARRQCRLERRIDPVDVV